MLQISQRQLDALSLQQALSLAPGIDGWLTTTLPSWAQMKGAMRLDQLACMLTLARTFGMHSRRDYAVFCWACASQGANFADPLSKPDLHEALKSTEWSPEAKLLRISEAFKLERQN